MAPTCLNLCIFELSSFLTLLVSNPKFLEDNPSAVHDASLMSGLSAMAVKMAREEEFSRSKT